MSLAEVLTAARALPRDEQLELARSLTYEPTTTVADLPPFFQEWIASGQPLEIQWPFEAPEAASELLRLLNEGQQK
jgi:hypothetical protein